MLEDKNQFHFGWNERSRVLTCRTSATRGWEGPTFFLRPLFSRHPDPTRYNPLFRDKPCHECFLLACLAAGDFDEEAAKKCRRWSRVS